MPQSQKPDSYEFHVNVSRYSIYFFINGYLHVTGDETHSTRHNHREYELRFFEDGIVNYGVGDRVYHCLPGNYLLVPPGYYHSQVNYEGDLPKLSQYNLRFSIELRGKKTEDSERLLKQIHTHLSSPRFVQQDSQRLNQLLCLMTYELYSRLPGHISTLKALCSALAVELLRPLCSSIPAVFPTEKDAYSGYMRTAIDNFFTRKYLTHVTIEDLAGDMQISVRQASRIIQNVYGTTFSQKLREMRVEAAKVFLTTSDQSITAIAAQCGFETYSYFYTCFVNHVGVAPNIYRQHNQKRGDRE